MDITNTSAPSTVVCCGAHEVVASGCINECDIENMSCANFGKPRPCPFYCEVGFHPCVCEGNYCRNSCGRCVKSTQRNAECTNATVTMCNKPNQVLVGCLNEYKHRTCENYFAGKNLTAEKGELCEPSVCDCAPGFWLNFFGECVRGHECGCYRSKDSTTDHPCPQNEELVGRDCGETFKYAKEGKCSGVSTRYRYGPDYNSNCVCKKNRVRSNCKSHRCILAEDCDRPCVCTDPCANIDNEIYTIFNDCNKRTCYNKYIYTFAPCDETGVWGCDCTIGYRRNSSDQCVPEEDCEPLEFYLQQNDAT